MSICHWVICSHSLENSNVLLKSIMSMDSLVFGQSFVGLTWNPCCYPSTPSNTGIQAKVDRKGSELLQLLCCPPYIL